MVKSQRRSNLRNNLLGKTGRRNNRWKRGQIYQERYKSLRNDHGVEEESSKTVEIKDLEIPENIVLTLLGVEGVLDWKRLGKNLVVELPENIEKQYAYTIKVGGIRNQYA